MYELSLNIMDIVQNSIRADAKLVSVSIDIDEGRDMLAIVIGDDGCGMDEESGKSAADPFFTTRTTRKVGLGLPYFEMAAKMCGGDFGIRSEPGKGTSVSASFQLSHIDRAPLGDTGQTFALLAGMNSDVDFALTLTRVCGGDYDSGSDSSGCGCSGDADADADADADVGGSNCGSFVFDTRSIKEALDGVPIDTPEVIIYMEDYINENVQKLTRGIDL